MRRYYIISGIFLILPIIDFAVAAPVLAQEKHQAGVDVVHIPKYSATMLVKRFDELSKLWPGFFHDAESDLLTLSSSPGARPPSSSQPSGPVDGGTDVNQPLPTIPEVQSPVSSPDHASPSPGIRINDLWVELHSDSEDDFAKTESSSTVRPSSSSQSPGLANGGTDVNQPLPTIPGEQSPAPSSNRAWLNLGDETKALWRELFGDSESPSAGRPSSSSPSSGTTEGGTDLKQHSPSIPAESSPVGSLTGYELMKGDAPPRA